MSTPAELPVIIDQAYAQVLWITRKIEKFPRDQRLTLGNRLSAASLDLLLTLVDAAYRRDKVPALREARRLVNALRFLLRLLTLDSHAFASTALDEIGRMAGGWEKSCPEAAHRAALGKRRRPDVAAFLMALEPELLAISADSKTPPSSPAPNTAPSPRRSSQAENAPPFYRRGSRRTRIVLPLAETAAPSERTSSQDTQTDRIKSACARPSIDCTRNSTTEGRPFRLAARWE